MPRRRSHGRGRGRAYSRRARRRLDRRADADDIVAVTKKVDGGTRGLRDRIAYTKKAAAVLKAKI